MLMKSLLLLLVLFASLPGLFGQCPERTWLWGRIIYLRDSSRIPPDAQLAELLPYIQKMDNCPYRNDSTNALLLQRVGWLISLQRDYVKAIHYTRMALELIYSHQNRPDINFSHTIKFYNNLRILYDSLGQERLKRVAMDSCISVAVRMNTGFQYAIPLINIRTIDLFEAGDYYRCISYATEGEDLIRKSGYSHDNIYSLLSWRLNALVFLNKFEEAGELLGKTLDECRREKAIKYLGSFYGIQARIFAEKDDFRKALSSTRLSCDFNKEAGYGNGCAEALTNQAFTVYFQKLHQLDTALQFYRTALQYADSTVSPSIFENIANVYVEKGRYDSAFYYFREAFRTLRPGTSVSGLPDGPDFAIKDPTVEEFVVELILDNADAFLSAYQTTKEPDYERQAITLYRQTDQLLDKIRQTLPEYFSRLFWRRHYRRLYENAIRACYLSGNAEGAFHFFEKSRAVLLTDQLEEQQGMRESEILQLAQWKKELHHLDESLREIADTAVRRDSIQNALFIARQQLDQMEQSIRSRNPLFYQSFLDTSTINLGIVRSRLLNDHEAVVELFTGDSADYCLIVTRRDIHLSRLNKADFDNTTRLFNSFVSNPLALSTHFDEYARSAQHLYHLIFPDNPPPDGRIIVSEDNQWFPFEALITSNSPSGQHYFLNGHAISYAYSARYLLYSAPNTGESYSGNFMGIAPIQYSPSLQLPGLPGSDRSIDLIAANFDGNFILISTKATRENFLREFYKYRIVQLYTHAADSAAGRNEPVIYFADSALYLSDLIPESKPATQLIVLSACETGSGQLYRGEGVFSFNRGFAALGIPSSIANLWAVEDQSTYRITELFYHYLSEGLPADKALQKAKLDFIGDGSGEKSLPYYWAAPVFAGDGTFSIPRSPAWPRWALPAGLLLLASFTILLLQRRYRRYRRP
jgi:CHAT domain-containing protein/tetratricopeptide (TPR) repeat protein